jgi:hypothetical protein
MINAMKLMVITENLGCIVSTALLPVFLAPQP